MTVGWLASPREFSSMSWKIQRQEVTTVTWSTKTAGGCWCGTAPNEGTVLGGPHLEDHGVRPEQDVDGTDEVDAEATEAAMLGRSIDPAEQELHE